MDERKTKKWRNNEEMSPSTIGARRGGLLCFIFALSPRFSLSFSLRFLQPPDNTNQPFLSPSITFFFFPLSKEYKRTAKSHVLLLPPLPPPRPRRRALPRARRARWLTDGHFRLADLPAVCLVHPARSGPPRGMRRGDTGDDQEVPQLRRHLRGGSSNALKQPGSLLPAAGLSAVTDVLEYQEVLGEAEGEKWRGNAFVLVGLKRKKKKLMFFSSSSFLIAFSSSLPRSAIESKYSK